MDKNPRKWEERGRAEKVREKRLKSLDSDPLKCCKLTEIFGSGVATASSSSGIHKVQQHSLREVKEVNVGGGGQSAAASASHDAEGQRAPQTCTGAAVRTVWNTGVFRLPPFQVPV